jgi:hypothetical protein
MPEIQRFEANMIEGNREYLKMHEIVERLDEVMAEKASKQDIRIVE